MNTYIDDTTMITWLLDFGWTVKNETWTNCPQSVYDRIKEEYL